MRLLRTLALLAFVLLAAGTLAAGQTATGEVNGTVTDPNGAVLSAATVTLVNQATNIEVRAQANQDGHFIFVNVKPGRYLLRVEAKGFKTVQTSIFDVGVSQAVTQDAALTLGEVSEAVQVTASAELVQRSSSELGTVIAERTVADL
ncbi:MAG TPA: carboxypeptidase-like regulatory domain-containing protein, partial [Pyrinomonadaceae bacterium]|nr:carboxypeptidase-like regulatory domain-containing protein [Pyrinomonadaceae bacterium]